MLGLSTTSAGVVLGHFYAVLLGSADEEEGRGV